MANLFTVASAKEDRGIRTAAGNCPDSSQFLSYLNDAIKRVLIRGDWWGTLARIKVCVNESCVTWPRFVGKIRAINRSGTSLLIQNQWWSFMPFDTGSACCEPSDFVAENQGTVPVFKNIPCGSHNWKVRAYPQRQADIGKTLTVYGIRDDNGQTIMTKRPDGSYLDGEVITLAIPFGSTTLDVRYIDRISLDACVGPVRLYGYDTVNDVLHNLAQYDAGETEPSYIFSMLNGRSCNCGPSNCNGVKSIDALIKISDEKLRLDADVLQIQNLEAIKQAITSVRKEEAGDVNGSEAFITKAVKEMNLQERDWIPDEQLPVQVAPWGTASLPKARIGFNF